MPALSLGSVHSLEPCHRPERQPQASLAEDEMQGAETSHAKQGHPGPAGRQLTR